MKAMVCSGYGGPDVFQLREVPTPEPGDGDIRIRVHATTVGYGDLTVRRFNAITPREFNMPLAFWLIARMSLGLRAPRAGILGSEFSGVVDAAGRGVTMFAPGDAVFGYLGQSMGANAEYLCMPARGCVTGMPANMSFEEAAAAPYGAIMALELLRKAGIRPGQRVLVLGASGGIGSAAVQLARHHFGAEVTGVCSTPRVAYVAALGASAVVDYTTTDFTVNGATYDCIFDVLGRSSWGRCRASLRDGGRYVRASFKGAQLMQMLWTRLTRGRTQVLCALAPGRRDTLCDVKALIEAGQLRSHVDRCFPLDALADAHRYVESGRRRGPVVVRVR